MITITNVGLQPYDRYYVKTKTPPQSWLVNGMVDYWVDHMSEYLDFHGSIVGQKMLIQQIINVAPTVLITGIPVSDVYIVFFPCNF